MDLWNLLSYNLYCHRSTFDYVTIKPQTRLLYDDNFSAFSLLKASNGLFEHQNGKFVSLNYLLIDDTFVREMLCKITERTKKQKEEIHQERNASHVKSTIKVMLFDVLNFFFFIHILLQPKNKKKKATAV